jgi:hypothetical protein
MSDRAAWTSALTTGIEPVRANKYHARKCTVDGIRFDSRKEARRYEELTILARAGAITSLELQPEFTITVVGLWQEDRREVVCGRFRADFRYVDLVSGEVVIEDAKSPATRTTAYRLRKRLVEAIHGVTIREV